MILDSLNKSHPNWILCLFCAAWNKLNSLDLGKIGNCSVKNSRCGAKTYQPSYNNSCKWDAFTVTKETLLWPTSKCQYKEVISKLFCHHKWTIILCVGVKQFQPMCVWVINTEHSRDRWRKWEGRMRRRKAKQFVHFRPQGCQLCDVRVKVWLTYEQWLSCPFCLAAPVSPHYTLSSGSHFT